MSYVPTYSEEEEEVVSVTLNLSNYVTQKEFKSLTKVDTSDFALKTNLTEIKKKFDDIDDDKIDFIDELQCKDYIKVICTLIKNINILNMIKLIHKNVCLCNQQEYLMKN